MEIIAGATSVIGIVSLAIQLTESIIELSDFLGSIQEAPDDVQTILTDLRILSMVLDDIKLHHTSYESNEVTAIALESLRQKITAFISLVTRYEPGCKSNSRRLRKWSAVKAAFKSNKFDKFRRSLSETKSTVQIALQLRSLQPNSTTINEENKPRHINQSSRIIVASSTDTRSGYQSHVVDLQSEVRRIASTLHSPAQQSIFIKEMNKVLQDLVPASHTLQENLSHEISTDQLSSGSELISSDNEQILQNEKAALAAPAVKRPLQMSSRVTKVFTTKTVLGTIYVKSAVRNSCEAFSHHDHNITHSIESYHETSFILHPAEWLVWLGMKTGLSGTISKSTQGWKNTLRAFYVIPDNSLIFEFCRSGNIDGIRSLLARGDASVWDKNSIGETPLHLATKYGSIKICELLIDEGAEKTASTYDNSLLPYTYCARPYQNDFINTEILRLFLDCLDFSDAPDHGYENGDFCWVLFYCLLLYEKNEYFIYIESDEGRRVYPKADSLCVWLVKIFRLDIARSLTKWRVLSLWHFTTSSLFLEWFMDMTESIYRHIDKDTGWSPIVNLSEEMIFYWWHDVDTGWAPKAVLLPDFYYHFCHPRCEMSKIKLLLQKGADPHYRRYEANDGLYGVTPTAILILTAFSLLAWKTGLRELNFNIEHFVDEELRIGPLDQDGWTKETLTKLFMTDLTSQQAELRPMEWDCAFCGSSEANLYAKSWMVFLEAIKNGHDVSELNNSHEAVKNDIYDEGSGIIFDDRHDDSIDCDQELELWYCESCMKERVWCLDSSTLDVPGSFEPITV